MTIATSISNTPGPLDITQIEVLVPVPIPFINMGMYAMATPEPTVIIDGMPSTNISCKVMLTPIDDVPGVVGGVASGTIMGPQTALSGAPNLLINGLPCQVSVLTSGIGNNTNTMVMALMGGGVTTEVV